MLKLEDFKMLELKQDSKSVTGGYKTHWIGGTQTKTVFLGFIISTGEKFDSGVDED